MLIYLNLLFRFKGDKKVPEKVIISDQNNINIDTNKDSIKDNSIKDNSINVSDKNLVD